MIELLTQVFGLEGWLGEVAGLGVTNGLQPTGHQQVTNFAEHSSTLPPI